MNPHYFNICLTVPMVAEDLGADFSFVGSSPDFAVDWRWFKALYGEARRFNEHFLAEYHLNCHTFLDYRRTFPRGELGHNLALEAAAWQFCETAAELDQAARTEGLCPPGGHPRILAQLRDIVARLQGYSEEHVRPFGEFEQVYCLPEVKPEDVRNMQTFAGLFGRETLFVSLEKGS